MDFTTTKNSSGEYVKKYLQRKVARRRQLRLQTILLKVTYQHGTYVKKANSSPRVLQGKSPGDEEGTPGDEGETPGNDRKTPGDEVGKAVSLNSF